MSLSEQVLSSLQDGSNTVPVAISASETVRFLPERITRWAFVLLTVTMSSSARDGSSLRLSLFFMLIDFLV